MELVRFFDTTSADESDGAKESISDEFPRDDEYDAINDETFGGDINDADEDLEEFANRTAGLLLEEPSCSTKINVDHNNTSFKSMKSELVPGTKTLEEIEFEQFATIRPQCASFPIEDIKPLSWPADYVTDCVQPMKNYFTMPPPLPPHFIPPQSAPYFSHPPPILEGVPFIHERRNYNNGNRMPSSRVPGSWISNSEKRIQGNVVQCSNGYATNERQRETYFKSGYNNKGYIPRHELRNSVSSIASASTHTSRRPKGLPSCKTISDFAFDPYAGFMSKKEREWLIKIHLIQCMGNGEPLDDDFYYTAWKKRNVLKKAPNAWKIKSRPRYYSFEDTYPSGTYIPPTFTGTLGKPTHCSAKIPRQIIDIPIENVDDDETSSGRNTQKKLKAMLMRIENAALFLTECGELQRKLSYAITEDEVNEVRDKLKSRMQCIMQLVCDEEILPTVMIIQKGRTLLFQLLDFCNPDDMFNIFKTVLETLPKYAKKIPDSSVIETCKHICVCLVTTTQEQVIELLNSFRFDTETVSSIKLMFYVVLALLISLVKSKSPISAISKSSTQEWLNSTSKNTTPGQDIYSMIMTSNVEDIFILDDLISLQHWLLQEISKPGNIAELLVHSMEKLLLLSKKKNCDLT